MQRREMLRMGTAALALALTGCKRRHKTVVQFVNASNVPVTVTAMAAGRNFTVTNLQIGGIASQSYLAPVADGTQVPVTGNIVAGPVNFNFPAGTAVTTGKTTTVTIVGDALVAPPTLNLLFSVQ